MPEAVGVLRIRKFGGLDTESPIDFMDPRDTPDSLNVWTQAGSILKRPSLQTAYNDPIDNANDDLAKALWGGIFDITGVTTLLLTGYGGHLYYSTTPYAGSATFGDLGAASLPNPDMRAAEYKGYLVFPGTTPKKLTSAALTSLGGSPPSMSTVLEYNNMLFSLLKDTNNELLHFSNINNGEIWTNTDTLTVSAGGAPLTDAYHCGEFILVTARDGLYAARGFGKNSLQVTPLDPSLGCVYPGGCEAMGGAIILAGRTRPMLPKYNSSSFATACAPWDNVYYVSPSGKVTALADKILSSALFVPETGVDFGRYATRNCIYHHGPTRTLYVIPRVQDITNGAQLGLGTTVWVMTEGGWHKWAFTKNSTVSWGITHLLPGRTSQEVFAVTECSKKDRRFLLSFSDTRPMDVTGVLDAVADTTQTHYWTTPYLFMSGSQMNDYIQAIYIYGTASGTASGVTVQCRKDEETAWTTINQADGTTYWPLVKSGRRISIDKDCRRIQFKLSFTSASYSAQIDGLDILYTPNTNQSTVS